MSYKAKEVVSAPKAELPSIDNEIFKIKIDRDTQKFFIDGLDAYGHFSEVTIRPLDTLTQIVAYNDKFEKASESILYRELKEARDSLGCAATDPYNKVKREFGGKVCGRYVWKNITDTLSEAEKDENKKKAKFYILIFGIANIKGKDNILVDFRIGGVNFMETANLLKKIKEEKKEYHKSELRITATPSEEFDWPHLEVMAEFSRDLPVTGLEPFFDTIEAFVQQTNEKIIEKGEKFKAWKEANKKPTSFKRK